VEDWLSSTIAVLNGFSETLNRHCS